MSELKEIRKMNEPIAWGMKGKDGNIYDVICHEEHDRAEGDYTIPLYTHPAKELTDAEIIESLAELEHQQWMKWAEAIIQTEKISDVRLARWASCMIPYAELSEEMKEHDRVWARQALAILKKAQEK